MPRIQIVRTTIHFRHGRIHNVNAHVVIHGHKDILVVDRTLIRFFAKAVRRPDDLTISHPAASEQAEVSPWPVVTTTFLVDFRRTPKFAPDADGDIVLQPTVVNVRDQT